MIKYLVELEFFSGANRDINFKDHSNFSGKFLLSGEDEEAIRSFFTEDLIKYLEEHEIYHIESNGEALMIFKYLHIARTDEVQNILTFGLNLLKHMNFKKD